MDNHAKTINPLKKIVELGDLNRPATPASTPQH